MLDLCIGKLLGEARGGDFVLVIRNKTEQRNEKKKKNMIEIIVVPKLSSLPMNKCFVN